MIHQTKDVRLVEGAERQTHRRSLIICIKKADLNSFLFGMASS